MNTFNISATLNIFKVLARPSLCLPQATISNFNELPIPIGEVFGDRFSRDGKAVDIKAVVLDKDDCFAKPKENVIHEPYQDHFQRLRKAYPGSRLIIVSNTAGATSLDKNLSLARTLNQNTGLHVLEHSTKKPGCGVEIIKYLQSQADTRDIRPDQIAIVGDRLFTDVLMANMMGSWGVWVKEGVVKEKGLVTRLEQRFAAFAVRRGYEAPIPKSPFE